MDEKTEAQSKLGAMSRETALRDVEWLAEYLNVSTSWVYQATAAGKIPCVRIGASVRFNPVEIKKWILDQSKR